MRLTNVYASTSYMLLATFSGQHLISKLECSAIGCKLHTCMKNISMTIWSRCTNFLLCKDCCNLVDISYLRWPRELNALQLQKTHANRKSTSKLRKDFHHFDSRWCKYSQHKQIKKHCKCSQHNQIHFICSVFLFWLCCEHLQRVCVVKITKVFS